MNTFWKHIKIILSSLLILSACTQMENPIVSNEKILKIETKWLADSNGIKKIKIYNKEFDRAGNLIKIIEFDSTGNSKKIHHFKYTKYDIIETIEYLSYNEDNVITQILTSINSSGQIIYKTQLKINGDTVSTYYYKYDVKGNLISTTVESNQKENIKIIEYAYNASGSLNSSIEKDCITGSIIRSDSLSYNYNNSTIDRFSFDYFGKIKTIISTSYNKFGKIYKEIENNPNLKTINTYIYEYIYY